MSSPKVYVASKPIHATLIKEFRFRYPTIHFVNRWIYTVGQVPETPQESRHFWLDDQTDVKSCETLVVYANPGDFLRGALVEVGMALAYKKEVVLVGDNTCYGTWQYHPQIDKVRSMNEAIDLITEIHELAEAMLDEEELDAS